jgi:hypothetical protein
MIMQLSEDFLDMLQEFSEPTATRALSLERLEDIRKKLPKDLIDFMTVYGECSLNGGLINVCDPIAYAGLSKQMFGKDRDFGTTVSELYAYSAFGNLFFWNAKYGSHTVDLLSGVVICCSLVDAKLNDPLAHRQMYVPFFMSRDALDAVDENGKPLLARAVKKLGPLEIGECYGFVPLLSLGGMRRLENLKRLKAREHFSIAAQSMQLRLVDARQYGNLDGVRLIGQ